MTHCDGNCGQELGRCLGEGLGIYCWWLVAHGSLEKPTFELLMLPYRSVSQTFISSLENVHS